MRTVCSGAAAAADGAAVNAMRSARTIFIPALLSLRRAVPVGQRLQEGNDVALLLRRQGRRIAALAVERRIGGIEVGAIRRRQVVGYAVRVDALRSRAAEIVEVEHLRQRV